MVRSSFVFFVATAITALSSNVLANEWSDPHVKQPIGFNAFPTSLDGANNCQVEVIFQKDANDQTYQYDVFGVFKGGKTGYLTPEKPKNGLNTLAYVDATPAGQRGNYYLKSNFVYVPILVNICNIGEKDPSYPADLKYQKPEFFRVRAKKAPKTPMSLSDDWSWFSNDFAIKAEHPTPQFDIIKNVWAKVGLDNKDPNHKNITVAWSGPSDTSEIQSYYVLVGPNSGTHHVQNFRFDEPKRTSVNIDIGYFTESIDVAVVVLNKYGGLTTWAAAPQEPLQQADKKIVKLVNRK